MRINEADYAVERWRPSKVAPADDPQLRASLPCPCALTPIFISTPSTHLWPISTLVRALTFPVTLMSSLTVPHGPGKVTWHVNPSLRPSQHAKELILEV